MLIFDNERYNTKYFEKIIKMMSEDRYQEAIFEWHKYIEGYPKDLSGYLQCADCYMSIGDFESAEKLLGKVFITENSAEEVKDRFIMFKVKLLCLEGKYNECLSLLKDNVDVFKKNDWVYTGTLLFLKKKLDILKQCDMSQATFYRKVKSMRNTGMD